MVYAVGCELLTSNSLFDSVQMISGEEAATAIIASILPGNPTLVTCVDDERMDFQARPSLPLQ